MRKRWILMAVVLASAGCEKKPPAAPPEPSLFSHFKALCLDTAARAEAAQAAAARAGFEPLRQTMEDAAAPEGFQPSATLERVVDTPPGDILTLRVGIVNTPAAGDAPSAVTDYCSLASSHSGPDAKAAAEELAQWVGVPGEKQPDPEGLLDMSLYLFRETPQGRTALPAEDKALRQAARQAGELRRVTTAIYQPGKTMFVLEAVRP